MDRRFRCGDCHSRLDECLCWVEDLLAEHHVLALSDLFPNLEVPC